MPIIKSAIKRMRQTATRRARNVSVKKDFRSAIKAFLASPTAEGLKKAQSELDTAVKKNVLQKNTASRKKANLVKAAKAAGVKVEASAKKAVKPAEKAAKPAKKTASKAEAKPKTAAKKPAVKKASAKKATMKKPAAKK